jgi:hypothetical protein
MESYEEKLVRYNKEYVKYMKEEAINRIRFEKHIVKEIFDEDLEYDDLIKMKLEFCDTGNFSDDDWKSLVLLALENK